MLRRFGFAACLALACDASPDPPPPAEHSERAAGEPSASERSGAPAPPSPADGALQAVAAVHGGSGPWAVLGYRMGQFAIRQLGLERGSFDLEVVHFSPRQVQYSCVADGAAAATGASLGKLNLTLNEAAAGEVRTLYRRKSTGAEIVLRPTAEFGARFRDVPRTELAAAGRRVLALRDEELFEPVEAVAN